ESHPRSPHCSFAGDTRCDLFHRGLQLSFGGAELVGQKGVRQVYASEVQEDRSRTANQDSRGHGPPWLSSLANERADRQAAGYSSRRTLVLSAGCVYVLPCLGKDSYAARCSLKCNPLR